ncbi:DUF2236 domain-containing protein [Massilia sp. RP-1-19]|uniref:DUF2236 domain-containing protein n=1 Tax=Massilia polaris TaxID=2728846 RepID=A0A848HLM8_9BURK|nr:oxygenase MpaB family protein [Massilia polaris]NML60143.1 DUF2236 domain-containing protein [Massilia polaris]
MKPASLRADPLADDTIARILGPATEAPIDILAIVNRQLAQWQSNGALADWKAGPDVAAPIAAALEDYVSAALKLPGWADDAKIARAETLFMDMSMTSCTLLFCASLPECYVVPELAGVLHAAGQLEQHTDYRIRSTAAMVFPVMMHGGLLGAGGGVAQAIKVRLIHATIRHLMLRGDPAAARDYAVVTPQPPQGEGLHHTLLANGWDVGRNGLPCNQDELAYTLLTFGYVFLRGLRRLGIGLPEADEEAYLHTWNVLGHLIGIERALMPETMAEAEAMFGAIQARARGASFLPDPRPALGAALMQTMENEIPLALCKPFPVLMTRFLCGPDAAQALALTARVSWPSSALFAVTMGAVRVIDSVVRLALPQFSIARLVTRIAGHRFAAKVLMDQTRPLKLPAALLNQVGSVLETWQADPSAPGWMNALERRLTGRRKQNPSPGPIKC